MERAVKDRSILDTFCENFCKIMEKHGFVAIASGRVRGTEDIDMIIPRLSVHQFLKIHEDLITNNFVCVQSDNPQIVYDYLKDNISVRYTYRNIPVPEMEIKFAKDNLDEYQLKTKQKLPLTGLDVWFSSINMFGIYHLV